MIGKNQILTHDTSMFMPFIENACIPQLRSGDRDYAKMTILVDGYNDDDRELWDIPEVTEWFKTLHKTYPYILYFLTPESIKLYFNILAPIVYDFISIDLIGEYCDELGLEAEPALSGKILNRQKIGVLFLNICCYFQPYFESLFGKDLPKYQDTLDDTFKKTAQIIKEMNWSV